LGFGFVLRAAFFFRVAFGVDGLSDGVVEVRVVFGALLAAGFLLALGCRSFSGVFVVGHVA
jgi:hypothetical protein